MSGEIVRVECQFFKSTKGCRFGRKCFNLHTCDKCNNHNGEGCPECSWCRHCSAWSKGKTYCVTCYQSFKRKSNPGWGSNHEQYCRNCQNESFGHPYCPTCYAMYQEGKRQQSSVTSSPATSTVSALHVLSTTSTVSSSQEETKREQKDSKTASPLTVLQESKTPASEQPAPTLFSSEQPVLPLSAKPVMPPPSVSMTTSDGKVVIHIFQVICSACTAHQAHAKTA